MKVYFIRFTFLRCLKIKMKPCWHSMKMILFFGKWYDVVCLHISFLIIPCLVVFDCFLYLFGFLCFFLLVWFCFCFVCLLVCLFVVFLFVFFKSIFFSNCFFFFSCFFYVWFFLGGGGFVEDACLHLLCYNL